VQLLLCALSRFDVELAKVNDSLKTEKQQRDKLHRERDELSAEKYTAEQELKVNLKLLDQVCVLNSCGNWFSIDNHRL